MNKYFGVLLMALAMGIAVVPQFNNCDYVGGFITTASGSHVPMKCLWSARALLGTGIGTLAVGAMMTTSLRKESWRNLSVMGIVLGGLTIALPTNLIGVCSSMMTCHTVMQPSMIALGSVVIAGGLGGLVMSARSKEKQI